MSQRRMFSPDIVESEEFITMPTSSQALYFHLGMQADDDGFVQPKLVMRTVGFQDDDLKVLLAKRFLLSFENGVVVIKHWLIHNMIRLDRYKPTRYIEEKKTLFTKENKAYTDIEPIGLQSGNQMAPQVRLGKVSIDTMLPSNEGGIENLLEDKSGIQHDYQFVGLDIFDKTSAPPNKKSECIRLAKTYPNFVNSALSFCLDYPNPKLKWKMFLWKLNTLIKENEVNKSNTK